jgi:Tol biopolymer transport system component
MFARKTWIWAIAALATGTFAFGSPADARTNGRIAWKSFVRVDGTWWIYAANPDGSHRRRLTHPASGVHDDLPDWSPDGSTILFERIFQSGSDLPTVADEIMRVNADGTGVRQIGSCTGDCVVNDDPQYSPDGRRIAYTRLMRAKPKGSLVLGVWVMDSNGSNPRQITQLTSPAGSEDHEPAWSPDGKSIVFMRLNDTAKPTAQQAVFIVASSGGTPRRITSWKLNAGGPNWSSDGSKILIQSYRDCPCSETSQVYTVAPDGSGLTRLTGTGKNIEPNWSPDGKTIIYAHQSATGAGQFDLWSMHASGKSKKPIVQTTGWESEPDWGTAPPVT